MIASTMGAARGTLGRVPTEFQRRAPAQDRTPAITNTPTSILMRSSLTVSLQLPPGPHGVWAGS
ncbi:hypothetical protein GCM10010378_64890 [Streptomyces viridochromogenes]